MEEEIELELTNAIQFAEESPFPDPKDAVEDVFFNKEKV